MRQHAAQVFLFLVMAVTVFAQDEQITPDAVLLVAKVQNALEHLETLQCSYEQLYYRAVDEHSIIRRGSLVLADASRLRFEDATKTIVVDGETVWMYIEPNGQVTVSDFVSDDESFPTPQSLFQRYAGAREASYTGSETIDGRMLDRILLPAVKADDADVTVWIDREYAFPVMTLEEYPGGDTNQYILRDLRLNEPVPDDTFVFSPPPDVEIIDMREEYE